MVVIGTAVACLAGLVASFAIVIAARGFATQDREALRRQARWVGRLIVAAVVAWVAVRAASISQPAAIAENFTALQTSSAWTGRAILAAILALAALRGRIGYLTPPGEDRR
jgi:phosphoglycerol transferase MdoB-like AlkP superfamily enzyme